MPWEDALGMFPRAFLPSWLQGDTLGYSGGNERSQNFSPKPSRRLLLHLRAPRSWEHTPSTSDPLFRRATGLKIPVISKGRSQPEKGNGRL